MAMISLKLWQLASLALPLILMLLGQTLLMLLYARFAVFPLLGRNYDAAILAAGLCGCGMGATPNAMANARVLIGKYAPSPKALFLLPLVGCHQASTPSMMPRASMRWGHSLCSSNEGLYTMLSGVSVCAWHH